MDTPDLTFDELTKLAENRQAWKRSVHWASADTSLSLTSPGRTVTLNPTTKSEAELHAIQKAWDELFEKKRSKPKVTAKANKTKPKRKKCKRKK